MVRIQQMKERNTPFDWSCGVAKKMTVCTLGLDSSNIVSREHEQQVQMTPYQTTKILFCWHFGVRDAFFTSVFRLPGNTGIEKGEHIQGMI